MFLAAYEDLRKIQALTNSSGYVNHVSQTITQEHIKQITEAMTVLAQNNAADHDNVANLITANETAAQQLATVMTTFQNIQTRLTALEPTGNNSNRNNGNRNRQAGRRQNDESYCHTHGRTRNPSHTSANCNSQADGHITTASLHNREGGSDRYCGRNN